MNKDLKDKSSKIDDLYEIAYKIIVLDGFLNKVIEQEKNKFPLNEIVEKNTKVLDDIFKKEFDKIDVIKKTMKIIHENLDQKTVIQYIDNVLIPNIENNLTKLNSNLELNLKLSQKIFNIIFSCFKLFPNIIKKNMEEFEKSQKIIADSLLEKSTIESIRDKLQKKKKKTKNINKEKEENINRMIRESKKSNIENLIKNDKCLKEFVEGLENELEEKENFIRQLLFDEYIHGENYMKYEQKINEQFNQVAISRDQIKDLEKNIKKISNEKDKLNKPIHLLNQEIALLKDRVFQINNKYKEAAKKNEELQNNISDLSGKNAELQNSISDLSNENDKLNENINEKDVENKRLQNDIYLLNLKIESKDGKINNLEKSNEYLKSQLQKLTEEFNTLKK